MKADRFIEQSERGEGTIIEYKTCTEQISESLYETVCSFLNHSGGQILVGVRNNGEIIGVNQEKAETLKANIITAIKNPELFLPCPYLLTRYWRLTTRPLYSSYPLWSVCVSLQRQILGQKWECRYRYYRST